MDPISDPDVRNRQIQKHPSPKPSEMVTIPAGTDAHNSLTIQGVTRKFLPEKRGITYFYALSGTQKPILMGKQPESLTIRGDT